MKSLFFFVDGEPRPKQSFRYVKGGGYTSASVKAWQEAVAWQAKIAMGDRQLMSGPLGVKMAFRLGNKRRVDLDNLSKGTLDSMNGIVFRDDTEVTSLILSKCVDKQVGVTVYVDVLEA